MTLRFVPYRAWHLRALIVQPRQAGIAATLQAEPNYPESLERPHALTVMIGHSAAICRWRAAASCTWNGTAPMPGR